MAETAAAAAATVGVVSACALVVIAVSLVFIGYQFYKWRQSEG